MIIGLIVHISVNYDVYLYYSASFLTTTVKDNMSVCVVLT